MTEPTEAQRRALRQAKALTFKTLIEPAPFQHRKFSSRTIEALLSFGIDAPERLLFMEERDLKKIPGVGKVSLAEIMAYRSRFLGG